MKLKSDFHDWYDYEFDNSGPDYVRMSEGAGMDREAMFINFDWHLKLDVPIYGTVEHVYYKLFNKYGKTAKLCDIVVYLDKMAHRGMGKIQCDIETAFEKYPKHFCSEYIQTVARTGSVSLRYLQIGERSWYIKYSSSDDWRSNCGNVDIQILGENKEGFHPKIFESMFAIDFVLGIKLYAIDFNIAPGILPIKDLISASDVVKEIKKGYERQQENNKIEI